MARLYKRAAKGLLYALAIIGTIVSLRIAKTLFLLNISTEATDVAMPRSIVGSFAYANHTQIKSHCQQRRTNITFLKIHKTASSTVQNILLRYGDKYNLNFVLPPRGHHLGYPDFFKAHRHMIRRPILPVYNIFCHHTRFDYQVINSLMPPDTVYVTILRDPIDTFESSFSYFLVGKRCGYKDTQESIMLDKFLENPMQCFKSLDNRAHTKNPLFYDLGLEHPDDENPAIINQALQLVDQTFSLVMITEYFEESLILLKNLLCLDFEETTYFRLNSRDQSSVSNLTAIQRQKIGKWNQADRALYDHFNRSLWQKIREYGEENMRRDIKILRGKNDMAKEKCLKNEGISNKDGEFRLFQPRGVKLNNFQLKEGAKGHKECEFMVMPETFFTDYLRKKQYPTLKKPSFFLN